MLKWEKRNSLFFPAQWKKHFFYEQKLYNGVQEKKHVILFIDLIFFRLVLDEALAPIQLVKYWEMERNRWFVRWWHECLWKMFLEMYLISRSSYGCQWIGWILAISTSTEDTRGMSLKIWNKFFFAIVPLFSNIILLHSSRSPIHRQNILEKLWTKFFFQQKSNRCNDEEFF